MIRLFISYRSSDSARVDALVARLRSLKHDDDTARYDIWQDKTSIPAGHDWWQEIVKGIDACQVFVFMLSRESARNINCRAELTYARKRGRAILPLVLEGEFALNPVSGKYDIAFWEEIPDELNDARLQFLFYEGVASVQAFVTTCERLALTCIDLPAPFPPDPRDASAAGHDTIAIYDQACDFAGRMEFVTAERLFQRLIDWGDPMFGEIAYEWIVLLRSYQQLIRLDERRSTRFQVPPLWAQYVQGFPKPFTPLFDPQDLNSRYGAEANPEPAVAPSAPAEEPRPQPDIPPPRREAASPAPPARGELDWLEDLEETTELAEEPHPQIDISQPRRKSAPITQLKPEARATPELAAAIRTILGDPFDLCDVPAGEFLYGENNQKLTLPTFAIAKYPITFSQFQAFIEAKDGFSDDRWWQGLAAGAGHRKQPGEQSEKTADHPRENVSWYDAVAFCRWLSFRLDGGWDIDRIAEWAVRLPTEFEWEKAARGTDGRLYPYGTQFDKTRCNTSEAGIDKTTPVTQYPQGASPYDVLDMSGNVWEWCLTDYAHPALNAVDENMRSDARRVLRGGSWLNPHGGARAVYRGDGRPDDRDWGFRVVRPPSVQS